MPLKFLKKCRHYNVTSKNLFVISVHHLLDTSTTVDCTISSDSKGQECLDNVCQRLLIQQPEFFGLRYVVKDKEDKEEIKWIWIDLERSLSRQLEKYAAGTKIFLRVRHYVTTGVRHLTDEVTRYYYFLQLKNDIYEGKIACDIATAILLALYCRQAEYDSYQNDKQTKDYLKKSLVLPKNLQGLANDDTLLDRLIVDVLQQNNLQHLTQAQAEDQYIQCCQQLEGYGEERFQAKDTLGNDLVLGLAINGMVVIAVNGRQYFPWKDFHTVTIDKRTIKIEQNKGDDGSIVGSFIFSEAETARYFWKLCITQHKFFKRHIDEDYSNSAAGDVESANGISIGGGTDIGGGNATTAFAYDFGDSREDLLLEQQQRAIYTSGTVAASNHEFLQQQQQQQHLHQQQQKQHQLQHELMTSASYSALMSSSNISLAASHQSGAAGNGATNNAHSGNNWLNKDDYSQNYISSQQRLSNSILDTTRLQSSSSCLDLSNNNNLHSGGILMHSNSNSSNNNNTHHLLTADSHERERLKAMLPLYRPAPDYETAVQLKYRNPSSSELHNLNNLPYQATAFAALPNSYYAGSQPDVHNVGIWNRFPDVTQPAMHGHHHLNAMHPQAVTANAIGMNSNIYVDFAQRLQMRSKPPPPYPVNRLSSSSTPDLAVASHRPYVSGYRAYVSGSSPDLVSNRNILNTQYQYAGSSGGAGGIGIATSNAAAGAMMHQNPYIGHSQPYLPHAHGTFENLNMIEEQPSLFIMPHMRQSALNQAASQSYEQSSPTLPTTYRPTSLPQQQANIVTQPLAASLQRGSSGMNEPIYENVPLPTYSAAPVTPKRSTDHRSSGSSHGSEVMRNRAPSIQSAPDGTPDMSSSSLSQQPPVPAARHHHPQSHNIYQQQQPQISHHPPPTSTESDEISLNIQKYNTQQAHVDRATSSELQFLEPIPPQRTARAASAAPAIAVTSSSLITTTTKPQQQQKTPPPRHQKVNPIQTALSVSAVDALSSSPISNSSTSTRLAVSQDDSLHQQFGAMMNLSSTSSSMYNNTSTLDTTATTAHSSSTSNSGVQKDTKRKKIWNILGRSKTPDKQKSATLGREKASTSSKFIKFKLAQDDLNLPHRWSTGGPKLQPISGQFSKDKLCQILDSKLNDTQLFMEFESIPKRRENARYDCALMEENSIKNSDPNFLPYEDNRVRIVPTMENRHGYVNASHISATVGTKQRFYIIAQSPQDELTTRIFWQCIWEADVYLIVQLSEDLNYIPPNTNQRLEFGQFQVYQEFSQTTDRCITSKLRLFHMQSRRYRSVWHLNYTDWGEQNCPRDVNHFLDFLEELNSVRMASINEVPPGHNTNPPVLIHCLEGGGRSGVTLTADLLLYTLDHNEDLDIPRVIGQLRHQRDNIIPSLAQYKFIYSLLTTYLKRTRLI